MSAKRTIAVVTGNRAEFGLLEPVMRAIQLHKSLTLRTVVTGAHLTRRTGHDVADAGFRLDARVVMQKPGEVGRDKDVQALARGIAGLGRLFARMKPDVVLVLGDRIEVLAAATAASIGGIRVGHIHGGDRAEGVADESIRHAVSKLSHLHFAATALSSKRLVRMGERRDLVFNTGSPAIDALRDVIPDDNAPQLIVLQHPIGASDGDERKWMTATLRATAKYSRLVIGPNSDPGSIGILAACRAMSVTPVMHLPRAEFLSQLAGARAIIGNSSAGLIEAAALRVPCVNIGPRQGGRERPGNVLDCNYEEAAIRQATTKALHLSRSRIRHPYGPGGTGVAIAELLAMVDLRDVPIRKHNAY